MQITLNITEKLVLVYDAPRAMTHHMTLDRREKKLLHANMPLVHPEQPILFLFEVGITLELVLKTMHWCNSCHLRWSCHNPIT
jgi:hypothetical protein